MPDMVTVETDDFTVDTNVATEKEVKEVLEKPKEEGEETTTKEAGKKGAEIKKARQDEREKAEAKAEKEKQAKSKEEKPEPDKKEEPEKEAKAEEDEKADKDKDNPRKSKDARFQKALRVEAEAKRRAQAAEQRAAELEQHLNALQGQQQAPQAQNAQQGTPGPPEPQPKDYQTQEEYVGALANWTKGQAVAEIRADMEAEQAQAREAQRKERLTQSTADFEAKFVAQRTKAQEEDPQFEEKLSPEVHELTPTPYALQKGEDLTCYNLIADVIFRSEHAPALMLHLSEHGDELRRIAALDSINVAYEMGKLEAKVSRAGATIVTPPAEPSAAKPPVTPVKASPVASEPNPGDSSLSDDEALELISQQKRRGRKR